MFILEGLADMVTGVLDVICSVLCVVVYTLMKGLFNLFISIAELDLLSKTNMSEVYNRVTVILTIVMVFYITFEFVKYTVSPDTFSDKEKGAGKLIYRIVAVILLIAFMPTIFSLAYDLQHRVIKSQVFSKIILGHENLDYKSYGSSFAADTFSVFYRVDYEECGSTCKEDQKIVDELVEHIRQKGGTFLPMLLANVGSARKGIVFDGILALLFGGFVCYILVMYSIDLGARYAQLIFLQIIAPVAIISYISPKKDNLFSKWTKQCITTYLDLFIRIALIYFILLIIEVIGDSLNIFEMTKNGDRVGLFTYIFLIFGLLLFVQKAPKMLTELFPSSGAASIGFGFSAKDRWKAVKTPYNVVTKSAATIAGGYRGLRSARQNRAEINKNTSRMRRPGSALLSAGKAMYAGAQHGYKHGNIAKARAAADAEVDAQIKLSEQGGNIYEKTFRSYKYTRDLIATNKKLEEYKAAKTIKEQLFAQVDEIGAIKTIKKKWDAAKSKGDAAEAARLEKTYKSACAEAREIITKNNGAVTDSAGNQISVKYKEYTYDSSGNMVANDVDFNLESGDSIFAKAIDHIAKQEHKKTKETALGSLEIDIPGIGPTPISNLTEEQFAKYMHLIADVAGTQEIMEKDETYSRNQANAQDQDKKQ